MMCSDVIATKPTATDTEEITSGDWTFSRTKSGSRICERNGSPTQPNTRLAKVTPSCVAER